MKLSNIAKVLLPMTVLLTGSTAAAQQKSSSYRIDVSLMASAEKPAADAPRRSAASVFKRVPRTVQLVGQAGVKLSLSAKSAGSGKLSVPTGGKSTCIRFFARGAGQASVPLELAIVNQGTADPCTGTAPVPPTFDLTGKSPEPQPYKTHSYWKLACSNGKCKWIKVIVQRPQGID
jgi:hypothetical protein